MTRAEVRTEVQQRLGDTSADIWTDEEINAYIQQGYDRLTLETGMLWDTHNVSRTVSSFTHTAAFEEAFIIAQSGGQIGGVAQFTAEFERNYVDNAEGPANHNYAWEYDGDFVDTVYVSPLVDLPDDLYQIERVTWKNRRIEPLRSRELEQQDARYELNQGEVEGYLADKDGLRRIRLWRVPSAPSGSIGFDYDDDSETWGLLRVLDEVDDSSVEGVWGEIVSIPGHEVSGGPWGVIRQVTTNVNDLRIEYRRRGETLATDVIEFEIPDRYVKYVRWFALSQALGREGDGQDMELADHYQSRFELGVQRCVRRRSMAQSQRKVVMGGAARRSGRMPRARLPYNYGAVVR